MTDAFDLSQAQIVNAPDVASWPRTAALTRIAFDGAVSRFTFTKQDGPDRWPDVTPKGWDGPLQYTVWLFRLLGGRWVGSAFIQFWHGRDGSGSPADPDVPSLYDQHWYYADRWAPLYGSGPIRSGESIGFMVTSGNQRDNSGPNSVQERSNVVLLPASDNAVFAFSAEDATVPTPPAPPVPTGPLPQPLPGPTWPNDNQAILEELQKHRVILEAIAAHMVTKEDLAPLATKQDVQAARNEFVGAVKQFEPLLRLLGRR